MKSEAVTKQVISGIALCYVALGTWLGYLSYQRFAQTIIGQCFGDSLCLLIPLSVTAFSVAIQNIRSPGVTAVRNLVAATMTFSCCSIIFLLMKTGRLPDSIVTGGISLVGIPLLFVLLYFLICHFLLPAAGYNELNPSSAQLQARIGRQEISDSAKKSLSGFMSTRATSTVAGYFLIVCSWFLFSLSIFYTIMNFHLAAKNSNRLTIDTYEFTTGFFWGAVVIYAIGKAHLKKVALAKAVIEMLEKNSDVSSETD